MKFQLTLTALLLFVFSSIASSKQIFGIEDARNSIRDPKNTDEMLIEMIPDSIIVNSAFDIVSEAILCYRPGLLDLIHRKIEKSLNLDPRIFGIAFLNVDDSPALDPTIQQICENLVVLGVDINAVSEKSKICALSEAILTGNRAVVSWVLSHPHFDVSRVDTLAFKTCLLALIKSTKSDLMEYYH